MLKRLTYALVLVLLASAASTFALERHQSKGKDRELTTLPTIGAQEESHAKTTPMAEAKLWDKCGLPTMGNKTRGKTLHRQGYITSYNPSTLLPNWVAWRLTPAHLDGNNKRGGIPYAEDYDVSPRQELGDWANAGKLGYDHGHMCPAGDNKWSKQAMEETFLLTNMCPQKRRLNQETWERLESACRKWVNKLGEIYIVCGPIFKSKKPKKLGSGNIPIPDAFFKVLLYAGSKGTQAIGFVYDNADPVEHDNMQNHVVPVSDIEAATGITFFPNLQPDLAKKLKSVSEFKQWNKLM